MKNLNLEEDIRNIAEAALEQGFKIFDLALIHGKSILKIKVLLDKLDDPWGTPTIADCARYTRRFDAGLTDLVNKGGMTEDYVLEVSSPGAERELKERSEWIRFREKPMKVRYNITPEKANTDVLSLVRVDDDMAYWKKAILKKDKKKTRKQSGEEIGIQIKDIIQVKLYLDF